jgi:sarcosine oxidase subunit beta
VIAADVVVIGGGVIGTSIAFRLAQAGVDVLLVERRDLASGTSGACDGGIGLQTKKPGPHLELAWHSAQMFPRLADELGHDFEYAMVGGLFLITSEAEWAVMEQFVAEQRAAGLDIVILEGDEARRREPALSPNVIAATYLDPRVGGLTDGLCNPHYLNYAYGAAARRHGARLMLWTEVSSLRMEGRRVIGVDTTAGPIACQTVVLAAGVWSPFIARTAGVDLPIWPRRGQILVTEPAAPRIRHFLHGATYILAKFRPDLVAQAADPLTRLGGALLMEQTTAGTILIGSTREFVGFDTRTTRRATAALAAEAARLVAGVTDLRIIRSYAGLRPYTPDSLPLLGPVAGVEGLVVAAGHEGDGIALSAITGVLIAEYLTGRPLTYPLAPFDPNRFAGRPLPAPGPR